MTVSAGTCIHSIYVEVRGQPWVSVFVFHLVLFLFFILIYCIICGYICEEIRGRLLEVNSFLLPHGFQESNSYLSCWQEPLPNKPSCQPCLPYTRQGLLFTAVYSRLAGPLNYRDALAPIFHLTVSELDYRCTLLHQNLLGFWGFQRKSSCFISQGLNFSSGRLAESRYKIYGYSVLTVPHYFQFSFPTEEKQNKGQSWQHTYTCNPNIQEADERSL